MMKAVSQFIDDNVPVSKIQTAGLSVLHIWENEHLIFCMIKWLHLKSCILFSNFCDKVIERSPINSDLRFAFEQQC